jgi:hypothetical protein
MVVRLQQFLLILLFVTAASFWSYIIYLDGFYYENAPREAVAEEGRVHPMFVHHGAKVFLTEQEIFNFEVLFPSISIGSILIAGLLDLRWKRFVFTKDFKAADPFSWLRRKKRN